MSLILGNHKLVLQAFATLADAAPSNTDYKYHLEYIKDAGKAGYISALNDLFAGHSDEQLAKMLLDTTGLNGIDLEGDGNNDNMGVATAFIKSNAANRVGAMLDLVDQLSKISTGPLATIAADYNSKIASGYAHASNPSNIAPQSNSQAKELNLTKDVDVLTGSSKNDVFNAWYNQLNDGDVLDGGAGNDTLKVDIYAADAITPITKNIENVLFRSQYKAWQSSTDNNMGEVKIDAQRMKDVTNWESNNSRADLLIEDVRINNDQITKDITITMRETDPGHVDYGVYFDQYSLRNVTNSTSRINIQILDTRAAVAGEDNLKGNADWGLKSFNFFVSTDGGATFKRVSIGSEDVTKARTVEQMRDALQKAADAEFGVGGVSVTLGEEYTVTDTKSGLKTTAKEITITAKGDLIFDATNAHSQGVNDKAGWTITNVPSDTGLHSNWNQDSESVTDLVTSTVVLDDVGRGSTGGDLVIGGLSVGDTSTSKGVGRFEITVEDDSKLQTISSTNDTLQEVTIKNGAQDRQPGAYNPIDSKGGKLVVNGQVNPAANGATDLPGGSKSLYGFQDVRLIDASFMAGKLEFTAHLSSASIDKYLKLRDAQPNPLHEDVKIEYTGGFNNDKMVVDLDADVTASRSKINVGKADFEFIFNGGAGNDEVNVAIDRHDVETTTEGAKHKLKDVTGFDTVLSTDANIRKGNTEVWYHNQKINNNITINGGTGDDVLKKPGAGDTYLFGGDGNDTIYADNSGAKAIKVGGKDLRAKAIWVFNTENQHDVTEQSSRILTDLKSAAIKTVGSYGVEVQVRFRGLLSQKVAINDKVDFKASQLDINQAIKKAINDDAVLSKLLQAEDGPAGTLVVFSKVDGTHAEDALQIGFQPPKDLSADIVDKYNAANGTSHANATSVLSEIKANVTSDLAGSLAKMNYLHARFGLTDIDPVAGAPIATFGANSVTTSDNVIEGVTGNDVIVLGTTVGTTELASSNDLVLFRGEFGHDTIVNFAATGMGADKFDFGTLHKAGAVATTLLNNAGAAFVAPGASIGVTNGQIRIDRKVVDVQANTTLNDNDSVEDVKQLFADGNTAAQQLYIAVDTVTGTGDVYQIIDGAAANDLQVNLLGHITLANNANVTGEAFDWDTLQISNFVL